MSKSILFLNILLDIFSFYPGLIGVISSTGRLGTNFVDSSDKTGITIPSFIPRATSTSKDFVKLYHTLTNTFQASKGAMKSISKLSTSVSASAKLGRQVTHANNAIKGASNAGGRLLSKGLFVTSIVANSYQLWDDLKSLYISFSGETVDMGCKEDVDCVCEDFLFDYTDDDIEELNELLAKEGDDENNMTYENVCYENGICYDYMTPHFERILKELEEKNKKNDESNDNEEKKDNEIMKKLSNGWKSINEGVKSFYHDSVKPFGSKMKSSIQSWFSKESQDDEDQQEFDNTIE